jgi:prolyl oligopeptidase
MKKRLLAAALLLAALSGAQAQVASPTVAPPAKDVPETFFGTTVHDPYRWLEDIKAPEAAKWMKESSERSHALLAAIPGRRKLLDTLEKVDASVSARVFGVVRESGDRWFFERRSASENQFKLLMRQGLDGREHVLVDPEAIEKKTGKPHAINYFAASPGGTHVAYGLSAQGSEAAVLHVLDTRSGRPAGRPISRADYGAPNFSSDGRHLIFSRLQAMKPGMPATEKYQRSKSFLMRVGGDPEKARAIFGVGVPGVEISPAEIPIAVFTHDSRWILGYVYNGTQREITLYATPAQPVLAGKAPRWTRLLTAADEITGAVYMNDGLYLVSHKDAPRSKVLRMALKAPDLAKAELIVPQGEQVITGISAAADALYVERRDGNVKRLYKRAHGATAELAEVKLPVEGSFQLNSDESLASAADPRFPGLVLDLQSWNRARQIYLVGADGSVRNSGLQPQGPYDTPDDVVTTEVKVASHDGALVPLSIIHRKGVALDGRSPTILYGYASYGITEEPFFSPGRLAWLDAGGVFAVANPRGSSVYGQDWYKAGWQASKPNTWKDFIACAQWLIAQKWTSPERLGILGGSAGGILVGRAMTERPDLFAAVVPAVGVLDAVRAEVTPNGVPNIPEFGTRTNEPGFRGLLAMSTYHQIVDGTKYPAVMLTHGVNDPRVEVWHSTKTAARLAAASTSGKPILLRLDYDAGHGIGNTRKQQMQERADVYAFFLWQMGVDGFQPKAP